MLSFPEEFLAEVDRTARDEHRTRSGLAREAMRQYMATRHVAQKPGDDLRVRQPVMVQDRLSDLAPGSGENSTADVRGWREGGCSAL